LTSQKVRFFPKLRFKHNHPSKLFYCY